MIEGFRLYYTDTPIDTLYKPFDYKKVGEAYLSSKKWTDRKWLKKASLSDAIELLHGSGKVIMLYDATQPPGDEQYVMRVYFIFNPDE